MVIATFVPLTVAGASTSIRCPAVQVVVVAVPKVGTQLVLRVIVPTDTPLTLTVYASDSAGLVLQTAVLLGVVKLVGMVRLNGQANVTMLEATGAPVPKKKLTALLDWVASVPKAVPLVLVQVIDPVEASVQSFDIVVGVKTVDEVAISNCPAEGAVPDPFPP